MLNSFWHSYWIFAISSFESCMIHTICELEGTHAEVHQTISHIVLLFQIKKKASFWFCGTDPFLESSSVSITELQKDDHRSLDPSWSSYGGNISFPQHTSTKPVSQSPFCRWLKKKNTKKWEWSSYSYKPCLAPVYPQYQRGTDGIRMSSLKHVRFFPQRLIRMCQLCWWQSYLVEGLQVVIYKAELQLLDL